MRIIHTSDWHLGQHFYGKSRANEHQYFLNWLVEQSQNQQVDAIIVAGDIFDTGTPPSYAREMYFDFIAKLNKTNCQLVVLAGNHDSVAMLSESKQLVSQLSTRVISTASDNIAEQVFVLNSLKTDQQAVICAIPFIRPRDIVKSYAGQSAREKQQSLQQAISAHYKALFAHAQALSQGNDKPRLPIIATGHLTTVGASTSESVRDIYIGTLEAFPASEFPGADYIALGHIHRPQKVTKSEHIRYSGSPIALSFDEVKTQKNIVIVDFKHGELSEVNLCNVPCFQPMAMVKTNLENLAQDITTVVSEQSKATDSAEIASLETETVEKAQEKIWLDIEIESSEYLQDLTARIEQLTQTMPVEVLLVRRSKKARAKMPASEKKITLSELSVQDVFDARIELEDWQSEEQLARKSRLNTLYSNIAEQVQLAPEQSSNAEDVVKTKSDAESKTKVEAKIESEVKNKAEQE